MSGAFVLSKSDPVETRWAFKCLVQGENDFVGLIAYGLYKKRKSDLADHHRVSGCTEEEIKQRVKDYHAMVVTGDAEIERFKREAKNLLDQMMDATAQAIKDEHKKEVVEIGEKHQKALEKAKKKAVDDLARTAKTSQAEEQHWLRTLGLWLFSGVPSAAATILLAALTLGAMTMLTGPSERGNLAAGIVNKAAGEEIVKPASAK